MTIPDVRDESAVIRAIEENLFELMDSLGTRCPGATYERREEWRRFLTGVPFPRATRCCARDWIGTVSMPR